MASLIRRLAVASLLSGLASCLPNPPPQFHDHCPPFRGGDFNITYFQLYPENAVWDSNHCLVYISVLFNGSVAQFDPYRNKVLDVFEFPGITNTNIEHASGLDWNPNDGLLSIVIDADPAFLTNGANVSGDYWLIKYDPQARRELWRANLTSLTGGRWGGFQDVTTSADGTAYVVGTYPSSIARVDPSGRHIEWFYPPQTDNTTVHGYTGIDHTGTTLLVVDNQGVIEESPEGNAAIFRFDMRDRHPSPVMVPLDPATPALGLSDTITLPPKYGGTVLLVSLDLVGVTVLRSLDGWRSAKQLGTIRSDFGKTFAQDLPATYPIAQRLYMIGEFFPGEFVPGTVSGNRSEFPMFDITTQVDALLAA